MHREIQEWFRYVKMLQPHFFAEHSVLDVGSLDINGTLKPFFSGCRYIGLDIGPGPNVDIVSVCHEFTGPDESFDVVVSADALEHDMHWQKTLKKMYDILKFGGLMIFTCASSGRGAHGTLADGPANSPLTTKIPIWQNYYGNLTGENIRSNLPLATFKRWEISTIHTPGWGSDLRFWGIK